MRRLKTTAWMSSPDSRVAMLKERLAACDLCPRGCGVDRLQSELGFCRAKGGLQVAHMGLHFGEEPPISGVNGSGTIFFTHCNLRCVYCQNYQISQQVETIPSRVLSPAGLADVMLSLEGRGAHNINLVSPTHVIAAVAESLLMARRQGLSIPIVYNTNGYDALSTLQALEGLVDIYLPDVRYSDNRHARAYSAVGDYVQVNRRAIREMYRQVGNLQFTPQGIARQGVLVRHLVLPQDVAGSQASLEFLASLSTEMYVSLMSQYAPHYRARSHPPLDRKITAFEYEHVLDQALSLGLDNCFVQELVSSDTLVPDFAQTQPFEY